MLLIGLHEVKNLVKRFQRHHRLDNAINEVKEKLWLGVAVQILVKKAIVHNEDTWHITKEKALLLDEFVFLSDVYSSNGYAFALVHELALFVLDLHHFKELLAFATLGAG